MNDNESNIVTLDVITTLDLPPERILNSALEADLETVVVIGHRKDGSEYFSSTITDGAAVVWMLERAKKKLLDVPEDLA